MIDKLKLWNYIALHHSSLQYQETGDSRKYYQYETMLDGMWYNYLGDAERAWISDKINSPPDDPIIYPRWDHISFIERILDMIKNIDKPVKIYEPLTEQLTLFD